MVAPPASIQRSRDSQPHVQTNRNRKPDKPFADGILFCRVIKQHCQSLHRRQGAHPAVSRWHYLSPPCEEPYGFGAVRRIEPRGPATPATFCTAVKFCPPPTQMTIEFPALRRLVRDAHPREKDFA